MTEIEKSARIAKAIKEINSIKYLLNRDKDNVFKLFDIVKQVSIKHNIPFNVLDRIVNWAVRDYMDLSKFRYLSKNNRNFKNIVATLESQFKTILNINGKLYIPEGEHFTKTITE